VAHDENQFHSGNFDAVFDTGQRFRADDVAGYSNAEDIDESEIEDQFWQELENRCNSARRPVVFAFVKSRRPDARSLAKADCRN